MRVEVDDKAIRGRIQKLSDNSPKIAEEVVTELGAIALKSARNYVPVDTGTLKGSITLEVNQSGDESEAEIGTVVEYAAAVEYGTSRQSPQPYLRPGVQDAQKKLSAVVKAVLKQYD